MNIRFKILQQSGTSNYKVVAILNFQAFEDPIKPQIKEDTIDALRDMFELEAISAEVTDKGNVTEIAIETQNEEKIQVLKKNMMRLFRDEAGIGNDNIHLN